MRPGAEGQMPVLRAADIERFGIGELRRIAIGGADAEGDPRLRRQGHAADLHLPRGDAVAKLVGAFETQELLHRRLGQAGLSNSRAF